MSLVPKPKEIFRNLVVATAGDLDKTGFDNARVQRYVTSWGGRFSADLDDSVTHLLVSEREMKAKKKHPRVLQGQKRRKLEIVSVEWLEDSIQKSKKQPTKPYSLVRQRQETNAAKKREIEKRKNVEKAGHFMNPDKYRVYTDSTFFRYEVLLTKGPDEGRIMLTLFESVAEPRLYHAAVKYWHAVKTTGAAAAAAATQGKKKRAPPRKPPLEMLLNPTPGSFERELAAFRKQFLKKTGVGWDRRLVAFAKGKAKVVPGLYVYQPPTGGKPVGLVKGRNPHEVDEEEDEDDSNDNPNNPRDAAAAVSQNQEDPVDKAVRTVLAAAAATNARAGDAIDTCIAALAAYKEERGTEAMAAHEKEEQCADAMA